MRWTGLICPKRAGKEARNYNQALLMAAQVRADLVDILFRVWDATFGQANPAGLGEEYFNCEDASPLPSGESGMRNATTTATTDLRRGRTVGWLFVWLVPPTKRTIALGVERYSEGDDVAELPANAADGLEGWHVVANANDNYSYFRQPIRRHGGVSRRSLPDSRSVPPGRPSRWSTSWRQD